MRKPRAALRSNAVARKAPTGDQVQSLGGVREAYYVRAQQHVPLDGPRRRCRSGTPLPSELPRSVSSARYQRQVSKARRSGGAPARWSFKKTAGLRQPPVGPETGKAGACHEGTPVPIEHGPVEQGLVVMRKEAVVLEIGAREGLLGHGDARRQCAAALR